jgi:hypothetical protein
MLGVARHQHSGLVFVANRSASGSIGNRANSPGTGIITMPSLSTGRYRIVLNGYHQVQQFVLTRQLPATFSGSLWVAGPTDTPARGDLSEAILRDQLLNAVDGFLLTPRQLKEGTHTAAPRYFTDFTFEFTLPLASYEGDTSTTLYWIVQNIQDFSSSYTGNYNLSVALYQM